MIQYKPTKWGFKLWVVADMSGYILDFDVYVGKAEKYSGDGLAHDVIMKLLQLYWFQGYEVFIDNFYTSAILLQHLLDVCAAGTLCTDHRGVPPTVVQLKFHMQTTKSKP